MALKKTGELKDGFIKDDISEKDHLFFKSSDYADFQKRTRHQGSEGQYNIRVSIAGNPNLLDTTIYYYEELYFERNGRFKKKIFLNTGCNAIEISGKWVFRTPFANMNSDRAQGETDIILDYDQAPPYGLPIRGNIYKLTISGPGNINLIQNSSESDSSSLGTRSNYSIILDHIIYTPFLKSINWSHYSPQYDTLKNGKVIHYWYNGCSDYSFSRPDDKIIIDDPLELIHTKEIKKLASYGLKPIRCLTPPPPPPECPLYCGLKMCGTFNARTFNSDLVDLNENHQSVLSVTADSATVTISNFANTGGSINVKMAKHVWTSCYSYDNFTITLGGKVINFESFNVESNGLGLKWLQANCKIDGQTRKIQYRL